MGIKRTFRAGERRYPLSIALFALVMLIPSSCERKDQEQQSDRIVPRNLILISMDTVRADHLGCYGYDRPTSPQIDTFAERAVVFENCTSPSSWTVPSHLSIFTSMEPATHGCVYYPKPPRLNKNFETLAKIFTREGFRTAAFTGGGYAGRRYGLDIGFEHFETRGLRFEYNIIPARRWLEDHEDERFFLFLHGFNAHRPYLPPAPYDTRFSEGYSGDYNIREYGPGKPKPGDEDLKYVISQYDGEIGFVDEMLGDFLTYLEQRGRLKDTLVILTSDHGDAFYEHGKCDHIHSLYAELTRVPWIMLGPSMPKKRIEQHVGTIDILPTVLSLMGLESDAPFQGVDRSNLLSEEGAANDSAIYMFTGVGGDPKHLSGVRTSRWKLLVDQPCGVSNPNCGRCARGEQEGTMIELFDLAADPNEQENVADSHPSVVRDLLARLSSRLAQCETLRLEAQTPPPASQEHLDALRSLGYVGSED